MHNEVNVKANKVLGIVILIIGLVMLGASFYIKNQVLQGRMQISSAQSKVDTGKSLFNMSPTTQPAGNMMFSGAQSQIDAGSAQADYYAQMANWLQIGGIVLIIVGAGIIFLSGRKK
jgi:hypothetical protein